MDHFNDSSALNRALNRFGTACNTTQLKRCKPFLDAQKIAWHVCLPGKLALG